jgi:hypothetical protein
VKRAVEWIEECDKKHECVVDGAKLPKSVLDVGNAGEDEVSMYMSNGENGKYAALSYVNDIDPSETTDQERIDMETLPQIFRDAITMTRKLGIRYLWIDALWQVAPPLPNSSPTSNSQPVTTSPAPPPPTHPSSQTPTSPSQQPALPAPLTACSLRALHRLLKLSNTPTPPAPALSTPPPSPENPLSIPPTTASSPLQPFRKTRGPSKNASSLREFYICARSKCTLNATCIFSAKPVSSCRDAPILSMPVRERSSLRLTEKARRSYCGTMF